MAMYWYPFLGWGVFWVALIASVVLFAIYRKLSVVMYLISVALYVFTAGFFIDVFDLGKGGILTVLIFSALLFMVLGYYISRVIADEVK